MRYLKIKISILILFLFALCSCATGFREYSRLTKEQVIDLAKEESTCAMTIEGRLWVPAEIAYDSIDGIYIDVLGEVADDYWLAFYYKKSSSDECYVIGTYCIDAYGFGGDLTPCKEGALLFKDSLSLSESYLNAQQAKEYFEDYSFEDGESRNVCRVFAIHDLNYLKCIDPADTCQLNIPLNPPWTWLIYSDTDSTCWVLTKDGKIFPFARKEKGGEK